MFGGCSRIIRIRQIFQMMPLNQRQAIMNAGGGTARLAALFEVVQKKPISRVIVQAIAQQDDYMKRVRRNGGARDVLAPKGVAILWGTGDKGLIQKLKLGPVGPDEFISYSRPIRLRLRFYVPRSISTEWTRSLRNGVPPTWRGSVRLTRNRK